MAIAASGCWFTDGINGCDRSETYNVTEFGSADDFVPAIDGGVLVVVLDGAEVGNSGAPDIFDIFGVAAAGGVKEGFNDGAVVGEDLSGGGVDGGLGSGGFVLDSAIDLAAGSVAEVEAIVSVSVTAVEGVGPGSDGLGFKGFLGPVTVHFTAEDAVEVAFEVYIVDGAESSTAGRNDGAASVPTIADPDDSIRVFGVDGDSGGTEFVEGDAASASCGSETIHALDFAEGLVGGCVGDCGVDGATDADLRYVFFDRDPEFEACG